MDCPCHLYPRGSEKLRRPGHLFWVPPQFQPRTKKKGRRSRRRGVQTTDGYRWTQADHQRGAVEIYRHKEGAVLLDLRIDPGAQYTDGALVTAATFRKPETFETTDSTISALNTQMMDALLSDR
jgi:hypothetical protein